MKAIFADAFYYFALLNPRDVDHSAAVRLTRDLHGPLVTTTWVLTEVADGMATRPANREAFRRLYESLEADDSVFIVPPTAALFEQGLSLYFSRSDKAWSLTDCLSFAVMQQEGIDEALTGDHHFEQAGFRALLK